MESTRMQSSFGVEQQQDRNIRQQNRSVIRGRVHHVCSSKWSFSILHLLFSIHQNEAFAPSKVQDFLR
jgi:hypothetical protein